VEKLLLLVFCQCKVIIAVLPAAAEDWFQKGKTDLRALEQKREKIIGSGDEQ